MRCIALGQAWQDHGGKVAFLTLCESEVLRQRIIDEGFAFIPIEKPHPDPYDLRTTLEALSAVSHQPSAGSPWLAQDGYHFNQQYQKKIREAEYRLLVMDDTAHLDRYYCDILVNQNIQNPEFRYDCDGNTVKFLGPRYALLRREFLEHGEFNKKTSEKARNILVTFGGADPYNVTLKVIKSLKMLKDPDIDVRLVVGSQRSDRKTKESSCTGNSSCY